jgi:hypothetical protein
MRLAGFFAAECPPMLGFGIFAFFDRAPMIVEGVVVTAQ